MLLDVNGKPFVLEDLLMSARTNGCHEILTGLWLIEGDYLSRNEDKFTALVSDDVSIFSSTNFWIYTDRKGEYPVGDIHDLEFILCYPSFVDPVMFPKRVGRVLGEAKCQASSPAEAIVWGVVDKLLELESFKAYFKTLSDDEKNKVFDDLCTVDERITENVRDLRPLAQKSLVRKILDRIF